MYLWGGEARRPRGGCAPVLAEPRLGLHLSAELRRWRRAGRRATLWWRDDDAREPTPPLLRLLAIARRARTPVSLAVVPDPRVAALAEMLVDHPDVSVIQHGVDHVNRRVGGCGEFPRQWSEQELARRLDAGRATLAGLPGWLPVFAPPWNDVHPKLGAALAACGYALLSADGGAARDAFPRLDCEVDLMRWGGGARFRGVDRVGRALAGALAARREAGA